MEGKEGDWECIGCRNRNYAFRSLCNRCKQARVFVDLKTPHDSKWLPRIGDWICTGCTNNNYASREKCKKCGQAKEAASMPAVAYGGGHPQAYYISDVTGGGEMKIHLPSSHNSASLFAPPLLNPSLSGSGIDRYRFPLAIHHAQNLLHSSSVLNGWRNGDWICNCGFHNYASREQCKQCNASSPLALGAKRSASEEGLQVTENKRLNLGNQVYQACQNLNQAQGATSSMVPSAYAFFSNLSSGMASDSQASASVPLQMPINALLGKGANYWRNGDWLCANCKNHNYASRTSCNRCKVERDAAAPPICSPLNEVCC